MFYYKKKWDAGKNKEKFFKFDMFAQSQNLEKDETTLKVGEPKQVFNYISEDGSLKSGYGFKKLCMPISQVDIENEVEIPIRGNEVKTLWKHKWYDKEEDIVNYYLFYFNEEANVCYDNIFKTRYATFIIPTTFTDIPFMTYYRKEGNDAVMLSGQGDKMTVITGTAKHTSDTAPQIISCCSHYGKLFAITASARGMLVYNDELNVLEWKNENTKDLDFSDERGDLNKIISFNDYLYLFRDFGITQVSDYGDKYSNFAISHIYLSDAFIYPNSIAQAGDNIFFLEGEKIKMFNGSSVKELNLNCLNLLKGQDNRFCCGECFNGKYYLACRGNFNDDRQVGCENCAEGYTNNVLLVVDPTSLHVDVLRGVDINKLLALTNKFKSKLVACYHNENVDKIGEITTDGTLFGQEQDALWESGKTDFNYSDKIKRVKSFLIHTDSDCEITFDTDKQQRKFIVKGKKGIQKINANVLGTNFQVKIKSKSKNVYISNFVLTVSVG